MYKIGGLEAATIDSVFDLSVLITVELKLLPQCLKGTDSAQRILSSIKLAS